MELKLKRLKEIARIVSSWWRVKTAHLLRKTRKSSVIWFYIKLTNSQPSQY